MHHNHDVDLSPEDRDHVSVVGRGTRTSADSAGGLGEGGSVSSAELPSEFFEARGISTKTAAARPYIRYMKGDPDGVVRAHWSNSPQFAARIARQASGIVIPRYTPRSLGLMSVPAELRPDAAVVTGSHWHYHGEPTRAQLLIPTTGNALPRRWIHLPEKMLQHIEKIHGGNNVQTVHLDENWAKYVFPPGDGAKRLDLHPQAWARFVNASRVFFVIEGCIKADAVLSAGEAVFSVPSVTLWNAPELRGFTRFLKGKAVYIVPDADWIKNGAVITQAMFCRTYLRRRSLEAHVAAPPIETGQKGIDDFLGSGGTMDDLTVLERETPFGLAEWLAERGRLRKDRVVRDAEMLQGLVTHAGPEGVYSGPLNSVARAIGTNRMRASRSIQSLQELGAVEIEGSLETRHRYYDRKDKTWKGLDWTDRPTIRVHADLRAKDTLRRLGD
jgi:hypothetical protein